ncbi:MAG: aspartate/glutamate racemase family protein [Maritimibacter sp.]
MKLGILSLDTAFPRIPGDVGAPETYPFPCEVLVVDGADSTKVVQDGPPTPDLVENFISAAQTLEARGATALVSTCGFLVSVQAQIAAAVSIPVMLSALSLYSMARIACPGRIGIMTASRASLGPNALAAAGIDPEMAEISGMDDSKLFSSTFLAPRSAQLREFSREAMERDVVAAARDLVRRGNGLSAVILECGNLPPYAAAIRAETGLPVFHLADAAHSLVRAGARS